MLYLVATPIGNLEDFSPRAKRILKEVDAIAAEDTRHTRKLLSHFDIHTPLFSFHKFNEKARAKEIISRLKTGESIAIVSDAGMPLISDAGYFLVEMLQKEFLEYSCIPGASAVETALVVSGLPTDKYQFLGFVPRDKKESKEFWKLALKNSLTSVFFESPKRLIKTFELICSKNGNRKVAVVRELTKVHEEVISGTALEVIETLKVRDEIKGECVVLIEPILEKQEEQTDVDIENLVSKVKNSGEISLSSAIKIVSAITGIHKNKIYKTAIKIMD